MAPKVILLPDMLNSIAIALIARITAFENGVGIFDLRGRMLGWIGCSDVEVSAQIVSELTGIVNDPRRAKQPDWTKYFTSEA
jgi:hypothetical protein